MPDEGLRRTFYASKCALFHSGDETGDVGWKSDGKTVNSKRRAGYRLVIIKDDGK